MWINIITQDITYREHKRKSPMTNSTQPHSPWSKHLYSSTLSSSASSQYSPLSSSPSLSRPCSQLSETSLSRLIYTTHCPTSLQTTPLPLRRPHHDKTHTPPPSPYRSRHNQIPSPANQGVYRTLYRPDIVKLSSSRGGRRRWQESLDDPGYNLRLPGSEDTVNSKSYFETSFASKTSEECKRESSSSNDDYSIVCDELLEELDADLQHFKFSPKLVTSNTKSFKENGGSRKREELYVNEMKMFELSDLDDEVEDLQVTNVNRYYKSHSSNGLLFHF
jgi:hypothetical protein